MKVNIKKILTIAMAYVGVIVGAGFASGQETLQYFVSFGKIGIIGAIIALILFSITGKVILELGSYFLAYEHSSVLDKIAHPILSRIIDICLIFSGVGIGLVMIAGAGSNLNQQYGLPIHFGSVLLSLLIIICAFLNVDKVTKVIASVTPFLIVFLIISSVYAIIVSSGSYDDLEKIAKEIPGGIDNWVYAPFNYVGMNLMTGFPMAIVMGGDEVNVKTSSKGGLFGGLFCGILILITTVALYSTVDIVGNSQMPLLELVNRLNPKLGILMSIIIFGMIFNTGTGVFYGMAARLSRNNKKRFPIYVILGVIVGYIISLVGFRELISYVYPIIGLVGIILIFLLFYVGIKYKKDIEEENDLRRQIYTNIVNKKQIGTEELYKKSKASYDNLKTKMENFIKN